MNAGSVDTMNLTILIPSQIFAEKSGIKRIVADTSYGSVGFLPHRLDCVAALVPGILIYECETEGECYVAVDEGVMVKTGLNVQVSVRNAITATDLSRLREVMEQEFIMIDEQEKSVRRVLTKMESRFIRHLAEFHHE
jgi:F-type H+-transporting ATPase subunit epsilon